MKRILVAVGIVALGLPAIAIQAQDAPVPDYTVDPFWPKVP